MLNKFVSCVPYLLGTNKQNNKFKNSLSFSNLNLNWKKILFNKVSSNLNNLILQSFQINKTLHLSNLKNILNILDFHKARNHIFLFFCEDKFQYLTF